MSVGHSKAHESATLHVTGKAIYSDDQLPPQGMLSLWPVVSPHAHAKILSIDTSKAREQAGIVTVLSHQDVPGINDSGPLVNDEVLLPDSHVYYHGQAVVWLVATSEEAASKAATLVRISYEPLDAILSLDKAIEQASFLGDQQIMQRGDVPAAMAAADHHLSAEIAVNGQDHFYLETHVSWAIPDSEGHMQVYASTQHPSETQAVVARVLGLAKHQVVVTCLRMGGGFGAKESQANAFAALAALAASKTGKACRLRLKRHHDMQLTGKRHSFLGRYQVAFSNAGLLQALDLKLYSDGGWSTDLSHPVMQRAMFHVDNCYYIPALSVVGQVMKTHRVSNTAFRGFGGPQGMLLIEDIIDRIARHLELTPEQVREMNFYRGEGETATTHYGQEIIDNRIQQVWQKVIDSADFVQRREACRNFNIQSSTEKRGLAITPVKFGISFTNTMLNQAGALIHIYLDGSIQLNHGGTEMGQGLHTKMLQVASSSLGVDVSRFRVMPTATDKVPNTSATAASSGSDLNGQAVKDACETLKRRLAVVAAEMLELNAPEALSFDQDWIFSAQQAAHRVAFEDVVHQAYLKQISLSTTGFYRTPNIYFNKMKGKGKPFYYYAYGAAVSEVSVDGFTGCYQLHRVDIVHDVGSSLNPLIDRGQIEGGFVQGMGWLTMEELVWDDQGKLLTVAPSTYKIPSVSEVPAVFNLQLLERSPQDGVIYGSKAVGEPPFMLALSVREALKDAIAAFGKSTAVTLASPATPEQVLFSIEQVKSASSS